MMIHVYVASQRDRACRICGTRTKWRIVAYNQQRGANVTTIWVNAPILAVCKPCAEKEAAGAEEKEAVTA